MIKRHVVSITTDAQGAGIGYSPVLSGRVHSIRYVKDDYADGVDLAITSEATGETILAEDNVNASATRAPRQATHSTAGVAALFAAGGAAVNDRIVLAADRVKIVVASGGDTKTGAFHITMD